jgi:phage terminase small subunit
MPRPRKSVKEKKLGGTYRADREPKKKSKRKKVSSSSGFPKAPITLKPHAKKLWNNFGAEVNRQGLLQSAASFKLLELYCEQAEIVFSCDKAIKSEGGLEKYLRGRNSQTCPELATAQKARTAMQGILSRMMRDKGKESGPSGDSPQEILQGLIAMEYSDISKEENEELVRLAEEFLANLKMEASLK